MGLFEESYQQLNAAQKAAVDTIDGPLLVVAGPGTGKTQLLSMRVANILRKTDTDAASILCLTFTNKAAINMQDRLLSLTGSDARGVMIKTFHSFAVELMNMYPDYFWNGARLTTAPDTVQLDIIQNILSRLPLANPLAITFAGTFTAGKDVRQALKLTKEAGLTPEKLRAILAANLAYIDQIESTLVDVLDSPLSAKKLTELQNNIQNLPDQGFSASLQPLEDLGKVIKESLEFALMKDQGTGKTKHTGAWKQRWVQTIDGNKGMFKERQRNAWWLSLADVYQQYRAELHSRGYYDYSDMLVEVIAQLQTKPDLAAEVRERFLYILIDEFQDTNAAQLQLANLVAGDPQNQPNIMVVGDDDQSIYKFNGAELGNMLSFQKTYPEAKRIVLTENYRSSQAVLDFSEQLIAQVTDRLTNRNPELVKSLVAKNPPKGKSSIVHSSYPTEAHELSIVARRIAKQYAASSASIAVLARDHASLERLASILHSLKIPVHYERQNNILQHPIIQLIYITTAACESIRTGNVTQTNVLLSTIIRAPMWQLEPKELWKLATSSAAKTSWLDACLQSNYLPLQEIAKWLLWLADQSTHQPLPLLLEYILGLRAGEHLTSPLRSYYFSDQTVDTQYLEALSAVKILQSLAIDFSAKQSPSLQDFSEFLRISIENNEVISDESVFVTGDHAVQLLSVHKAKGLEFDVVHIINAVDTNWRPNKAGRKPPSNLPLQPAGEDESDYVRLFFVAATRARQHVYIHSYTHDVQGKEVLATPMLVDILPKVDAQDSIDPITILEEQISWPRLNASNEKRNLAPRLESFAMSATALIDFLDLSRGGPNTFLEKHLLKLPTESSSTASFGVAMHSALEYAQIATNTGILNIEKVIDTFSASLQKLYLPAHDTTRYIEHGSQLLRSLLASDTFWLGKGDVPEQSISDVRIGDARIKGTLDRIHQTKEALLVIDYKTGKPLSSFTTRDQTKAIKAWRHKMQLIFYALLLQSSGRFKTPLIKGQIWYLEASSPKELVREYIPSSEDITRMQQLVEIIWPKIQSLNLPDVRNYSSDYRGIQNFEQDLLDGKI